MDDLAAWLTEIWDEAEKALLQITHEGDRPHWPGCQFPGDVPGYCNCDLTEQMLARIAADRQILELHTPYQRITGLGCDTCLGSAVRGKPAYASGWPCPTLKILASAYADRPGYQEAWKPE